MSVETTSTTMRSYLDALLARGDFADYFSDEVTWITIGTQQTIQGRQPVQEFLLWMHTQAFDAHPKVKTLVVGDGQAALEADFVATHTGEFLGIPATGKSVQVPYCVVYDLQQERSPPFAPTSPWTCSPNSSSELDLGLVGPPVTRPVPQWLGRRPQPNPERGDHHGPR